MDNFFILPNEIFTYELTPIEFCVVCYLAKCRNTTTQKCFPSKSTIAKACGIAVSSVSKAIKSLEEKSVIEITHHRQGKRQQNNSYELIF